MRLGRPACLSMVLATQFAGAVSAYAACPIELAVYKNVETEAGIDFQPTGTSATVTNSFKMSFPEGVVLDGMVIWTDGVRRARGMLMNDCPEGDVTGEEIAACTVWEGIVYAADEKGRIGLLPAEGTEAPKTLIMADLGPYMRMSVLYEEDGIKQVPWDVFELSGCQE
ncbi:hypothetical protein QBK99_21990 [Corticibacterium sp. UT-5YL-CI-8]|nr:hypothetical protein [Tianweitania sp. UT-5YL-CI-8]